jgi:hypothetical protein
MLHQSTKGWNEYNIMEDIIEFQFKDRVKGVGLSCRVALQIEVIENANDIDYESRDASTNDYKSEISFAIACFRGVFYKKFPTAGAKIIIHRLGVFDVDSRSIVVFYVFLSALCKAINQKLDNLRFDFENGVLLIPADL